MTFWKKALYSKGLHRCTQISLQDWAFKTLLCLSMSRVRRAACLTHSPETSPCALTHTHLDNDPPLQTTKPHFTLAQAALNICSSLRCKRQLQRASLQPLFKIMQGTWQPSQIQKDSIPTAAWQMQLELLPSATQGKCRLFLSKRKGWTLNLIKLCFSRQSQQNITAYPPA